MWCGKAIGSAFLARHRRRIAITAAVGSLAVGVVGCAPAPPAVPGGASAGLSRAEATAWVNNQRRDVFANSAPFAYSVRPLRIEEAELTRGWLWNTRCPVRWENLDVLSVRYRGFDGKSHTGRLVIRRGWAVPVSLVFGRMYEDGFRIDQMDFMITLAAVQYQDLATNNTYAFHCRKTISGGSWSQHAYGEAVDINPVQNPYHRPSNGYVFPPAGAAYVQRNPLRTGMIGANGLVETAFYLVGWKWGGRWTYAQDYMHFSRSGT